MKDFAAFRRDTRLLLLLMVVLTPNRTLITAHNIDESQVIAEIERLGGKVQRDDIARPARNGGRTIKKL
jgi:hypothetical protein